jgi:hypothetical protein
VIGGQEASPSKAPRGAGDRAGLNIPISAGKAPEWNSSDETRASPGCPGRERRRISGAAPARGAGRDGHLAAAGRAVRKDRQGSAKEGHPKKGRERTGGGRVTKVNGLPFTIGAKTGCRNRRRPGSRFCKEAADKAEEGKGTADASRCGGRSLWPHSRPADEGRADPSEGGDPRPFSGARIGELPGQPGDRLGPARRLSGRARIARRREGSSEPLEADRTPAKPCSAQWGSAAMPGPISHVRQVQASNGWTPEDAPR